MRGLQWLVERQRETGDWEETEFTGTGFPNHFYLRYHLYAHYFPLMALGRLRKRMTRTRRVTERSRAQVVKTIAILGSTGSVGVTTLDVVDRFRDRFRVVAMAAGNNLDLLVDQIERFIARTGVGRDGRTRARI